jgi:hypothetical protein
VGIILVEYTVDLDSRRGTAAQKGIGKRRKLAAVEAQPLPCWGRLEHCLLAGPATNWSEVVPKVRYLLTLFAQTPAAEDLKRARLIADVFADFDRLLAEPERAPGGGDAGSQPRASFGEGLRR